uniref:ER lumen protein-retaining receptor A-like n=1 Tax=Diabrotica virgifera virgifera TaxID=50390 RepID=A0A6P7FEA5_DIAVI
MFVFLLAYIYETNFFLIVGNFSLITAIFYLIWSILNEKSYAGVSVKSQFLYLTVFVTRCVAISGNFFALFMIFPMSVALILAFRMKNTYEKKLDNFWAEFLIVASFFLAAFVHDSVHYNILTPFNENLEMVALLPQIYMIWKSNKIIKHVKVYMFYMYLYRCLNVVRWIHIHCAYGSNNIRSAIVLAVDFLIMTTCIVFLRHKKIILYHHEEKEVTKPQNTCHVNPELPSITATTLVDEKLEK